MVHFSQEPQILQRPVTVKRVLASFVLAFLFMLLPWRGALLLLRPDLLLLLLLYWTVREPRVLGGWTAFTLGLLADAADSSVLGIHALGYSISHALAIQYRLRILSFYRLDQALHVLPLVLVSQAVTATVMFFLKTPQPHWFWWLQTPLTTLLWTLLPLWLERQSKPQAEPPRAA